MGIHLFPLEKEAKSGQKLEEVVNYFLFIPFFKEKKKSISPKKKKVFQKNTFPLPLADPSFICHALHKAPLFAGLAPPGGTRRTGMWECIKTAASTKVPCSNTGTGFTIFNGGAF